MSEIHAERTRMDRDIALIEPNPVWTEENDRPETVWRSTWEMEEWAYEQGYESDIDELWQMLPSDMVKEIGMVHLQEGADAAKCRIREEVDNSMDVFTSEHLSDYVDGQFRLFAGYDVAENGDTLEEGDYSTWENLRIHWEAGIRDKLRGNEKYENIEQ